MCFFFSRLKGDVGIQGPTGPTGPQGPTGIAALNIQTVNAPNANHNGSTYIGVQVVPATINLISSNTHGYGKLLVIKDETGTANGVNFITINPDGLDKFYFSSSGTLSSSAIIDTLGGSYILMANSGGWVIL